jgi:hypothetical protein
MARRISSVEAFAQLADIRDVQFYELHGRLYSAFDNEEDRREPGSQEVNFKVRLGETFLAFRLRLEVFGEAGRYLADAAVIFRIAEPVDPVAPGIMKSFIEKEAFPVLYPFVRQSLYDVAARLAAEVPILGLLRVDGFDFQLQIATEEFAGGSPKIES